MSRPDFQTLEAVPARPDLRIVDGRFMDREEYDTCGWFITDSHKADNGKTVTIWKAELAGLQRYGEIIHARREAAKAARRARNEYQEEADAYYSSLADSKKESA